MDHAFPRLSALLLPLFSATGVRFADPPEFPENIGIGSPIFSGAVRSGRFWRPALQLQEKFLLADGLLLVDLKVVLAASFDHLALVLHSLQHRIDIRAFDAVPHERPHLSRRYSIRVFLKDISDEVRLAHFGYRGTARGDLLRWRDAGGNWCGRYRRL